MKKILFLGLLLMSTDLLAQKYLVLEKMGTRKRFEYSIGSTFAFQLKGEDFFRSGTITDLVDSIIVLDYTFFNIKNVEAVNIRGREKSRVNASPYPITLVTAGAILFLGDLFNETIVEGNSASLDKGITIASSSMVGVGLLWMFLRNDTRKLKRNWRLRIVDI